MRPATYSDCWNGAGALIHVKLHPRAPTPPLRSGFCGNSHSQSCATSSRAHLNSPSSTLDSLTLGQLVHYDLVIVGGGPAGLSLACLAGGLGLRIAVVDQQGLDQLASPARDGRDIALTHRSVQILGKAGAWSTIAAEDIAPIRRACVKNADESHVLSFDHDCTGRAALGYLVSNQSLRAALYRAARSDENVEFITGDTATGLELGGPLAGISLTSGKSLTTSLVVAADSRFSDDAPQGRYRRRYPGFWTCLHRLPLEA